MPFFSARALYHFSIALILVLTALTAAGQAQGSLEFDPPEGWIEGVPGGPMRVAEFTLPKARGDAEDAIAGDHLLRWGGWKPRRESRAGISQMGQPDGRPSQEAAISTTFEANGLPVTVLDVPGTYVAPVRPGSSMRYNKPSFRLKAAVVETAAGPYFFKLTGPRRRRSLG